MSDDLETSAAVERCVQDAIADAQRALEIAEKCRDILRQLPVEIIARANANRCWLQFSNCTRAQARLVMMTLHAGRWEKKISGGNSAMIDYEGTVNGVKVLIYAAPPPDSCRVIEEQEVMPATVITKRRLVCSSSPS